MFKKRHYKKIIEFIRRIDFNHRKSISKSLLIAYFIVLFKEDDPKFNEEKFIEEILK